MASSLQSPQFQNFASAIGLPKKQGTGFNYSTQSQYLNAGQRPTIGQTLIGSLKNRSSIAQQNYVQQGQQNTQSLASDVLGKSGGTVPFDATGHPTNQPLTDYTTLFNKRIHDTTDVGKTALQAAQARTAFSNAKGVQDMQAGPYTYSSQDLPAGATKDNVGAQAVAIAMKAYTAKTPYVWGGNSLKNGVDCSGLVQQAYGQLGIKVPRTTYEQAKSGKVVSRNQLLPGDLIFYNTGSRDPNGVGTNGHVAIYMGNGKVIEAANSRAGIRISNVDSPGQYNIAVRPW